LVFIHILRYALSRIGISSVNNLQVPSDGKEISPGIEFTDRREFAAQAHHGYPVRKRELAKVTGICLHQTACYMGERPSRYDGTGSHFIVTRAGRVIWLHDFNRRVVAANGWNDGTISIEVDGLYAGVDGDPKTVWDDPSTPIRETGMQLTAESVRAALDLLAWIRARVPSVRVIVAHRQSSGDRPNDPGSAIWQSVALECGLETSPQTVLGTGKPIPEKWDRRCKGVRY
jgi:N-acetyl-anhydromuramyl-L-alanine amidase AmpD